MDAITEILTLSWILTPNATFICLRKHLHFKDSQNTVTTIRLWCSVVRPPQPLFTEKQSIKSTSWTWQHLKGRLSGIGTSCFTSSASCCALGVQTASQWVALSASAASWRAGLAPIYDFLITSSSISGFLPLLSSLLALVSKLCPLYSFK